MRLSSIRLRTRGMPDYALKRFVWQGKGLYARLNNTAGATGANSIVFFMNGLLTPMSNFVVTEFNTFATSPGETSTMNLYYVAYVVTYYVLELWLTNLDTTHVVWAAVHPNEYSSVFITSTDANDTPPYIQRVGAVSVRLSPNGTAGCAKKLTFRYGMGKAGGLRKGAITDQDEFSGLLGSVPTNPIASLYAVLSMTREDVGTTALNVAMEAKATFYTKLQQKRPNVVA